MPIVLSRDLMDYHSQVVESSEHVMNIPKKNMWFYCDSGSFLDLGILPEIAGSISD